MRKHLFMAIIFTLFIGEAYSQQSGSSSKKSKKPVYELASPQEFKNKMEKEPGVLIDVRTPSEQSKGIIKGAKTMDIFADNFENQLDQLDKNKTYYVYCAAGGRSLEACELMQKKGFSHVVDLDGGYSKWKKEGLPVSN